MEREFIRLGWCLLERKAAYYEPEKGMPDPPPDSEYDAYEKRYLELARQLGREPTAYCVGFPKTRPSAQLAKRKALTRGFTPWEA